MAELASHFRRGKEIFKQFYSEGPINPKTGVHHYAAKEPPKNLELQELVESCDINEAVEFMNGESISPKTAKKAYFATILCLGGKAIDQEREQREQQGPS